ncbi:FAD-dependent oxidoreductase [Massilimicrobiota timonensis]|uniref:FAD-dependent oxidoreductase n=1 Tax=Massilimicrobiota timonensis TaxID=1776392 RepID=UPI001961A5F3|nr:FAD-dependent oxidoreductase [Massilimicrobiota timonensis]MBM6967203.1 FAD-dependent oxidoreductase [Massilimicrobiota timonensis]
MKVVIIGGVAAGATTAARLRRLNKDVEIIMFEKGNYVSYANCGLPYYVSGEIREKSDLLLMTPELFKERFQVDVRVGSEVKAIDPDNQTVAVYNHITEKTYQESYDQLVIATGSAPIRLPIPGIDHPDIQQLWTIEDFVKIRQMVELKNIQTACIIGGGFVGIETAENLRELKVDVDVVEKGAQILNNLDFEMVQPIHKYLNKKGVHLYLNTELMAFEDDHSKIQVKTDAFTKSYDLVILSVGVKPQSELAKQAGIACNQRGGIIVDEHLMTNIPHIYAVGDVIEVEHYINHQKTMIPLAGPANKEGRILANHLMGANESYQGSLGSSIIKVFKMAAASTGFNEKQLQAQGLKRHQDYEVVIIQQKSHAGYYPGATPLTIKVIYDLQQKILGAQVVGYEGVDKRIDVISTAIHYHGKVTDLKDLHIAYAPPFASAKDAVNMVGYVAENIQNGYVKLMLPDEYQQQKDQVITLDVREDEERQVGYIEGSYHIPYGELTKRYQELDTNQTIVIYCAVGVRAYNCARILMQRGYQKVYVLSGGLGFYLDYCYK